MGQKQPGLEGAPAGVLGKPAFSCLSFLMGAVTCEPDLPICSPPQSQPRDAIAEKGYKGGWTVAFTAPGRVYSLPLESSPSPPGSPWPHCEFSGPEVAGWQWEEGGAVRASRAWGL